MDNSNLTKSQTSIQGKENKVWIAIITIIVTGGLSFGGTYAYVNNRSVNDKSDLQAKLDAQTNQVANLQNEIKALQNSTPSPTPSVTPSQAPSVTTADWKNYTNQSFNYTLKYPSDWTYQRMKVMDQEPDSVLDSTITFLSGQEQQIQITVEYKAKTGFSNLTNYAKDKITSLGGGAMGGSGVVQSDTTIGNLNVKKLTVPGNSGRDVYYLLEHNDIFLTIQSQDNLNELADILSTFQFTK